MKLQIRQAYAVAGGLLLGVGLTAYVEPDAPVIVVGIGAGLMVLARVRE